VYGCGVSYFNIFEKHSKYFGVGNQNPNQSFEEDAMIFFMELYFQYRYMKISLFTP
jgi:hypothetical protein